MLYFVLFGSTIGLAQPMESSSVDSSVEADSIGQPVEESDVQSIGLPEGSQTN